MPGRAMTAAIEAVLITCPSWLVSRMRGTNARMPWMTPQRLTSTTRCQSSSESSQLRPPRTMPALLTATCSRPNRCTTAAPSCSTAPASLTSTGSAATSAPLARSRCSCVLSCSSSRSAMNTRMSAARNASVIASPIPLAAPVTTATRPSIVFNVTPSRLQHDSDRTRGPVRGNSERLDGIVEREPVRDDRRDDLDVAHQHLRGILDVTTGSVGAVTKGGEKPCLVHEKGAPGDGQGPGSVHTDDHDGAGRSDELGASSEGLLGARSVDDDVVPAARPHPTSEPLAGVRLMGMSRLDGHVSGSLLMGRGYRQQPEPACTDDRDAVTR